MAVQEGNMNVKIWVEGWEAMDILNSADVEREQV